MVRSGLFAAFALPAALAVWPDALNGCLLWRKPTGCNGS